MGALCAMPIVPEPQLPPDIGSGRLSLIRPHLHKWVNGTVLRYYFFDRDSDGEMVQFEDGTTEWRSWVGSGVEMDVVRNAFRQWKALGIGLEFVEVDSRDEAEVRIGFMDGDGAWSYLGRQILDIPADQRTMNFGWDITNDIDTAIHEIGHTIGMSHEHQNPNSGIVWDEEAVYAALAAPPNKWPREKTYYNIIRKIPAETIEGSVWDPNSIMHYPFEAGLILQPEEYRSGLNPTPGFSQRDKDWVRAFYPAIAADEYEELRPMQSQSLAVMNGQQRNFVIRPTATRYYNICTFGASDTVMVLFENENGDLRYRTGDDDSGEDRNAQFRVKLLRNHKYVLRVRLNYADRADETAVMIW
ncbi:MAG: hypothetical protein H6818_21810 [Phycisphaerales bacterium]|nr:hypothetical protein [Phycisphaerales bacterium]MCB9862428.1 hypothetical protein [Phycisphaerales bacterium]